MQDELKGSHHPCPLITPVALNLNASFDYIQIHNKTSYQWRTFVHSKGSESPYSTGHDVKCVTCNSITDIKHDLARTRSGITHLQ